jgi:hypothetical protein
VALALAERARVVVRPWAGFVAARRAALELVETEWTFMLDADERLDANLREALVALRPEAGIDAYAVRRLTFFCGRPIRYGPWGADAPVRLFRTARGVLSPTAARGRVELHERWSVPGEVGRLDGTLAHFSYPTLASYRSKFARYTSLEARGSRGSLAGVARACAVALLRAPWYLFVKGGCRDGWRGIFVALASACYPVAVAWKALRAAR